MRKIFSIAAFVILVSCSKEKNMLESEKNETSEKIKNSIHGNQIFFNTLTYLKNKCKNQN